MCAPGWSVRSFVRRVSRGLVLTAHYMPGDRVSVTAFKWNPENPLSEGVGYVVGGIEKDGVLSLVHDMDDYKMIWDHELTPFLEQVQEALPVASVLIA